jgi:hypothetical protein
MCSIDLKTMTRVIAFVRRLDPIGIQAINEVGIIIRKQKYLKY